MLISFGFWTLHSSQRNPESKNIKKISELDFRDLQNKRENNKNSEHYKLVLFCKPYFNLGTCEKYPTRVFPLVPEILALASLNTESRHLKKFFPPVDIAIENAKTTIPLDQIRSVAT